MFACLAWVFPEARHETLRASLIEWYGLRVSESARPTLFKRSELFVWMLVFVVLQGAVLVQAGAIERDVEELFSAGQAWLAMSGDAQWFVHMQYRPYCGGCSVHAATAVGLFGLLGPYWGVWKLIPVLWGVLGLAVGFVMLAGAQGLVTSRCFALLWLLAPNTFVHLSLTAWGNHYESGVLALCAALLALRARRNRGLVLLLSLIHI